MESNTQPRDYDKDPIVIDDYNPMLHMPVIFIAGAIFLYFEITLHKSSNPMGFWALTFFPALFFYFYLRKAKRVIVIKANELLYHENKQSLESIRIDEIKNIERTFNDFYLKQQQMNPEWTFRIWLSKIISPLEYLFLLVSKFVFHLVKNRLTAYKLFDAVLVTTEDKRIINILPTNNSEYEIVRRFFLEKCAIDIAIAPIVIKYDYMDEEIAKKK